MIQKLLIIANFVMICGLCGPIGSYDFIPPPTTFQDTDLVGVWQVEYNAILDTIVIKSDGTYQQRVKSDLYKYFYQSGWNKWQVEYRENGNIWVHFTGMQYYAKGLQQVGVDEYVPKGVFNLYDPVEEVVVENTNGILLRMEGTRNRNSLHGIILCHMIFDLDTMPGCFRQVSGGPILVE